MPLTSKGEEILGNMRKEYGSKAKEVLYASKNAGTVSGIDEIARMTQVSEGPGMDAVLNWGGSVNAETVLPGGKSDTPNMPRSASVATGVGSTVNVDMMSESSGKDVSVAGMVAAAKQRGAAVTPGRKFTNSTQSATVIAEPKNPSGSAAPKVSTPPSPNIGRGISSLGSNLGKAASAGAEVGRKIASGGVDEELTQEDEWSPEARQAAVRARQTGQSSVAEYANQNRNRTGLNLQQKAVRARHEAGVAGAYAKASKPTLGNLARGAKEAVKHVGAALASGAEKVVGG